MWPYYSEEEEKTQHGSSNQCKQIEPRGVAQWRPTREAQECLHFILTVHVHQDTDVGASHSVENLTGNGLGEEGVICRGDKHTLSGSLQQDSAFCPPDETAELNRCSKCCVKYWEVCLLCVSLGDPDVKSNECFYIINRMNNHSVSQTLRPGSVSLQLCKPLCFIFTDL